MKYHFINSLCLFICFICQPSFGQNVNIIESQSYNSGHIMDEKWLAVAEQLGYAASILQQDALADLSLFDNTDILIVSSALIELSSASYLQTIIDFVESGRPAYIQAEFTVDKPGNITFDSLMNNLDVDFEWISTVSGDLQPMTVIGPLSTTPHVVNSLSYFWYGASGEGAGVSPFLEYEGNYFGFIYSDSLNVNGTVVTTSDQDWIVHGISPNLMENILTMLAASTMTTSLAYKGNRNADWAIFPNPAKGAFSIGFEEVQYQVQIKLMDVKGKILFTVSEQNVSQVLLEKNLEPGFYLVQVSNGESAPITERLIIASP